MTITSLTSRISSLRSNPMRDYDPAWRLMVQDHKASLKANAMKVKALTANDLNKYQYNIKAWLQACGKPTDQFWVTLFINDLASNIDFNMSLIGKPFYIVNSDDVSKLLNKYRTKINR